MTRLIFNHGFGPTYISFIRTLTIFLGFSYDIKWYFLSVVSNNIFLVLYKKGLHSILKSYLFVYIVISWCHLFVFIFWCRFYYTNSLEFNKHIFYTFTFFNNFKPFFFVYSKKPIAFIHYQPLNRCLIHLHLKFGSNLNQRPSSNSKRFHLYEAILVNDYYTYLFY